MYIDTDERVNNLGETIMAYASSCGCFTRAQAYYMRPLTAENSIDYALKRLVERRSLYNYMGDQDKFILNPQVPYDEDKIKALWVLLVHKGDRILECDNGYWVSRGRVPFQLSYIMKGTLYDIMALREDNKINLVLIRRAEEELAMEIEANEADKDTHKFFFLIDDESIIPKLPLIDVPHYFAIVDPQNVECPVRIIEDNGNGDSVLEAEETEEEEITLQNEEDEEEESV